MDGYSSLLTSSRLLCSLATRLTCRSVVLGKRSFLILNSRKGLPALEA
jgi:hypothetical protein